MSLYPIEFKKLELVFILFKSAGFLPKVWPSALLITALWSTELAASLSLILFISDKLKPILR